jgi:alpha-2-macroglobulin-like protein
MAVSSNTNDAGENAYVLALAANALAAFDAKDDSTLQLLQRLDKQRKDVPEWKAVHFPAKGTSLTYSRGNGVTIETTALTALAMMKTGQFTTSVNKALTYLIKAKEGNGTWGSTQATILSLKALLRGLGGQPHKGRTPFVVKVNGEQVARGEVTEDNFDVMQLFDLKAHTRPGLNKVELAVKGETALMYQIVGRYYEPWKKDVVAAKKPVLDIKVEYDRTKLATSDILKAKATLKYEGPVPTYMVMIDLGIAPGFAVDGGEFAEMVGKKQIQKFSVTARTVTLYLGDIRPGDVKTFEYTLRPRYPIRAQAPAAVAYEYYTPANRAASRPVQLTVTEKK